MSDGLDDLLEGFMSYVRPNANGRRKCMTCAGKGTLRKQIGSREYPQPCPKCGGVGSSLVKA